MNRYPETEYGHTQNASMAEKLIRAQGEQILRGEEDNNVR